MKPFSKYFDHTLLKPDASEAEIKRLCSEAVKYDFCAVCVNPCHVSLASEELEKTSIRIAAVTGFPLGASEMSAKAYEAEKACGSGAVEIDMVMNIGALKEGRYKYVSDDIGQVASAVYDNDALLKVIIETGMLTNEQIIKAVTIAADSGADFIKTSTGFCESGASVASVKLIRTTLDDIPGKHVQIKASGGIRDLDTAQNMIRAGAERLGTSSTVSIFSEYLKRA
ncbi:MAG TPA: deoxyribose-phosphate aldolase [Bacillota bacterium]|nr:deoxyribose-phosphate aldolase [Bacillota bacterium]